MRRENINYLAVGVFVLSMIVLLLIVLLKLSGRDVATDPYNVLFANIAGIREGSSVTYGGYQIGQIDKIMPLRELGKTHYRLELAVESGWKIPDDSVARIISTGLLSDNVIEILEGESNVYLSPGDTVKGEASSSIMAMLDMIAFNIDDISKNDIKPLIKNLNRHIEQIGGHLDQEIPGITSDIKDLLKRFGKNAEDLDKLLGDKNQRHLANVFQNADEISVNFKEMTAGFSDVSSQLERLLKDTNETISANKEDIRYSVSELRNSLESISQNIDSIIYNLETTSRNVNEFSRQIRDNPGVLIGGRAPHDEVSE